MTTYFRPNLTPEQRDFLITTLETQLNAISWKDPAFELTYRTLLKLQDCKEIWAGKR